MCDAKLREGRGEEVREGQEVVVVGEGRVVMRE